MSGFYYQVETVNKHIKNRKYKDAPRTSKYGKGCRLLLQTELQDWARSLAKIHNGTYHVKLKAGL